MFSHKFNHLNAEHVACLTSYVKNMSSILSQYEILHGCCPVLDPDFNHIPLIFFSEFKHKKGGNIVRNVEKRIRGEQKSSAQFHTCFPLDTRSEKHWFAWFRNTDKNFLAPLTDYIGLMRTEKLSVEAGSAMSNFYHDFFQFLISSGWS